MQILNSESNLQNQINGTAYPQPPSLDNRSLLRR